MIVYDGLQQPCIGVRNGLCHNTARYRAMATGAFVHVCEQCVERFRDDPTWTLTELTGRDELDAQSPNPVGLARDMPWLISYNGVSREDLLRGAG